MHGFLWGVTLGVPAGVFATYFGAKGVIAEYRKAASGSAFTITGTGTDALTYMCAGN